MKKGRKERGMKQRVKRILHLEHITLGYIMIRKKEKKRKKKRGKETGRRKRKGEEGKKEREERV